MGNMMVREVIPPSNHPDVTLSEMDQITTIFIVIFGPLRPARRLNLMNHNPSIRGDGG